ncbi:MULTISPECIES: SDR family oxidoreductase [unclassified Sphingomonas]|uniref:SDR family oxidoreductase n=1 Tax=unclassified Sphingomonas TaxID=196159 RepID=UPI000701D3E1|nr:MULTISPECIES: SDR family oxidoreductase [unclassified Sphingomonas]KQX25594.1 3-oxoacyl-ACP reductase [Sphingomonas sp. Root1294]KQY66584.1 3-oxoacyl-ACP reductase [Sphingomonas sp. Root50]KRB90093.1 3-oxoacyl-ACP reductase [Sphingomonas sp. Root720]
MDLGIKGRKAIVCAASHGLGRACAMALAREGVDVAINGRDPEALARTAAEIRAEAAGVAVHEVAGSIVDQPVREALAAAFGEPDILVNNAGGPPPGDYRDWDRDTWIAAVDQNLLSAVELIRMTADGMAARGFGRIVNITSSAVRVPIPVIGLSNATRAGLTNFVFGLVPQYSSRGVTINNLLPGPFDTNRLRHSKEITRHLTGNAVAGRIGDPAEMGATCAFLCSVHAGYINGQNILMDGGLYPGAF